ncbi:MAG: type II toxin-antitoxin system RelE/ParE family toxin [Candidatus Desantisbacteria bacterium]
MNIKILSSASQDLIDGYWFYEKQEQGIGCYFLNSLFSDIDSLRIYAGIHPIYFSRYYRLLSKRFPFAIYYRIEDKTVLVYAIFDCRRDPALIKDRLK